MTGGFTAAEPSAANRQGPAAKVAGHNARSPVADLGAGVVDFATLLSSQSAPTAPAAPAAPAAAAAAAAAVAEPTRSDAAPRPDNPRQRLNSVCGWAQTAALAGNAGAAPAVAAAGGDGGEPNSLTADAAPGTPAPPSVPVQRGLRQHARPTNAVVTAWPGDFATLPDADAGAAVARAPATAGEDPTVADTAFADSAAPSGLVLAQVTSPLCGWTPTIVLANAAAGMPQAAPAADANGALVASATGSRPAVLAGAEPSQAAAEPATGALPGPGAADRKLSEAADSVERSAGAGTGTGSDTESAGGAGPDPAVLPAVATAAQPARASAPPPVAAIMLPSDPDSGFDDAFGARVAWMADQGIGHAEIHISPEHIGPIDVRVQLDGNRVTAQFHSVHAEVRQALEASLPSLRDLLGQHGLQLAHADIGQRQPGSGQGRAMPAPSAGAGGTGPAESEAVAGPRRLSRGLLDEYA